jgi:protein involved in polysaccharide export with SLBB domain
MNPKYFLLFIALFGMVSLSPAAIIKTGDMLDIVVVQHAEFSGRYTVSENGTIDYPLLADVAIINNTTSELMNDLTLRLARHIDNPLVLISIVQKPEMGVTVLGQVLKPGPVVVLQGATLQEVIQAAGGPLVETADLEHVKINHPTRQPSTETCNLKQFLIDGDLEKLPQLYTNDCIVIPAQQKTAKIKVIGAVQRPGLFPLEGKTSVFEMIYLAGGPAEKADLSRVRRLSQQNGKSTEELIDVQSYIDNGKMDGIPLVAEGDIIIVHTKWFDGKALLTILNNTLLLLVTLQTFTGVFK